MKNPEVNVGLPTPNLARELCNAHMNSTKALEPATLTRFTEFCHFVAFGLESAEGVSPGQGRGSFREVIGWKQV